MVVGARTRWPDLRHPADPRLRPIAPNARSQGLSSTRAVVPLGTERVRPRLCRIRCPWLGETATPRDRIVERMSAPPWLSGDEETRSNFGVGDVLRDRSHFELNRYPIAASTRARGSGGCADERVSSFSNRHAVRPDAM